MSTLIIAASFGLFLVLVPVAFCLAWAGGGDAGMLRVPEQ